MPPQLVDSFERERKEQEARYDKRVEQGKLRVVLCPGCKRKVYDKAILAVIRCNHCKFGYPKTSSVALTQKGNTHA